MRSAGLALAMSLASPAGAAGLLVVPPAGGVELVEIWDISGDGRVLVGQCAVAGDWQPCRWRTEGGYELLEQPLVGAALALGTSADGSVVVGARYADPAIEERAVRWGPDGRIEDLPAVPGSSWSEAWKVSADGSVVVGGVIFTAGEQRAFRWTREGGMQLSPEPGFAYGVSADGSLVVGCCMPPTGAFVWTQDGGMTPLPSRDEAGDGALGVSADGTTLVGAPLPVAGTAWRWTATGGFETVAPPPEGDVPLALDASADGSVVVGSLYDRRGEGFVWDETFGGRTLLRALSERGVSTTGWESIDQVGAVSDDGRRVPGRGVRADGTSAAVIAVLAPACDDGLDNDGDGLVDLADRGCRSAGSNTEQRTGCGMGFEVALLLTPLAARARRREPREPGS